MSTCSGANDPDDRTDVWGFSEGKTWLCYIWIAALNMDVTPENPMGGTRYIEAIGRTLGKDVEDGFNEDFEDGGLTREANELEAHPRRRRKIPLGINAPNAGNDATMATCACTSTIHIHIHIHNFTCIATHEQLHLHMHMKSFTDTRTDTRTCRATASQPHAHAVIHRHTHMQSHSQSTTCT